MTDFCLASLETIQTRFCTTLDLSENPPEIAQGRETLYRDEYKYYSFILFIDNYQS